MPHLLETVAKTLRQHCSSWVRFLPGLTCVPVLTLIILMLLEVFLRQGNLADALGFRSVDIWNLPPKLAVYRDTQPDVCIIGSSLLLVLNLEKNQTHTFEKLYPRYLQQQLRAATHQEVTCINLCTGSQVVSETYLLTWAILNQEDPAPVIIYGLSLRDFMSNKFAREWSCDSFASLAPYVPVQQSVLQTMSCDTARFEFLLDHFFYLWRDRTDFKNILVAVTQNLLDYLPLDRPYLRISNTNALSPSREGWLPEQWIPRKHLSGQFKAHPEILKNFYRQLHIESYQQGSEATRQLEAHYLEAIAEGCQAKGVKLVLVNMPLSPEIMALAPPGLNEAFAQYLKSVQEHYGAVVVDFFGAPGFTSGLFSDTVHLDFTGQSKLSDELIQELKQNHPEILKAMVDHAQARAANAKLKAEKERPYNLPQP